MAKDFYTAVEGRRSIYGISKEVSISDDKIKEIIEFALKHTPSSFNSQTARIVLLLGEQHDKLWNLTEAALRKVVGDNNFAPTEEKMKSFRNGYGTVLFFEDQQVVEQLQKDFALYKDNFPIWSQQSSGMHQFVIWTALEMEGLGATLQHYNPLIDEDVRKEWNVPAHWKLIAQMPFGQPTMAPKEKEYKPLDERFKTFK
ncbi:nitroreductase family protein [Brevibacillus laterosporus]|uniref:Nitroreductase n=2 Tax=Brevibacillus TaxID=55080 RepID=A0A0F7EIN1_BRELA|nr:MULTISPECIES: nitroreductase family protein [Brevibacillus]AKF95022.1 nitroreductase [Brevibacillus laterosporus]MCR8986344.1 nitroreductase family protein [Brevibacillus laterosporus]MCZ0832078.1 nitroreductase family protein [Brevibacillus halotolerans]MDN9010866.1 nitroreductase family protein [Brevibacillus laterosporus]MDO0941889.1 nitroreductase family protein [Brevibacillus laterosporus]